MACFTALGSLAPQSGSFLCYAVLIVTVRIDDPELHTNSAPANAVAM